MKTNRNIHWHDGDVSRQERWSKLDLAGATIWITGLSGSGKSTLSSALERALVDRKISCYRLDGDGLRHGLNADLGFSPEDRDENIRRAGEVARLLADFGCIVVASFISPYRTARNAIRNSHEQDSLPFFEIFMDTPLDVCEARDPKGIYKKARAGQIRELTGVDAPYEAPIAPELRIDGARTTIEDSVKDVESLLRARGVIQS